MATDGAGVVWGSWLPCTRHGSDVTQNKGTEEPVSALDVVTWLPDFPNNSFIEI